MCKKIFLFLLCFGLLSSGIVNSQWQFEKCPTRNNLNAVWLTGKNSGWIVGNNGTILYLKDGNWMEYQKPVFENLRSLFFISENDGWAVGDNGTIIRYDGKSWKSCPSPTDKNLYSVSFKDPENGIATGELGTILIYNNGVWNVMKNQIRGDLFSGSFRNDEVWIGGGLECINLAIKKMFYNAGGVTLIKDFDSFGSISSICSLSPDNAWAVGSPGIILHFNGFSWEKPSLEEKFSSLKSVYFSDENNGISVGYGGTILIFSGNKWLKDKSNTTKNLKGTAIGENIYYAVGDSGTIISKSLLTTGIASTHTEQPAERIEVYPNPCDEVLYVNLPDAYLYSPVTISISNASGQLFMQKKLNDWKGNRDIPVVTSALKNGLYFLSVNFGSKTTKVKFIVIDQL